MPKVKFLKDLCSGQAGSVHDLQDYEVNVLIQLGAAEVISDNQSIEPAEQDKTSAEKGD
ncbi:hypothetical protein [Acinetobacter sp. ANC 3791]|uniref:hypothetical protein n=1 Tax=Acinetobacter sp. ANC 3791 TaxID=2529836 RepID=UPI0013F14D26|nr:hypothetical protein [Acinetobacter sp. ANC 3791]